MMQLGEYNGFYIFSVWSSIFNLNKRKHAASREMWRICSNVCRQRWEMHLLAVRDPFSSALEVFYTQKYRLLLIFIVNIANNIFMIAAPKEY